MKILIVGAGGREHALAWKAAQSDRAERVYVAPGNAGTAQEPGIRNIAIGADDIKALTAFAAKEQIGLTIIGPEAPLVAGIVDAFHAAGLNCFGPSGAAAMLEGSKSFTKDFLKKYRIPTADYAVFTEAGPALEYLKSKPLPIVIKADGLAAGKGVVIAATAAEAQAAVRAMLTGRKFGAAGQRVVIEEFLQGEEISFIVMAAGAQVLPLASSQDHKARDAGDKGPNTGGMGAYSPMPRVDQGLHERVMADIIMPTVRGMRRENRSYTGFLYAGLMLGRDGAPRVLEFNCRLGDPETQAIIPRLNSDLVELCLTATAGRLDQAELKWDRRFALGVVTAAAGYPATVKKGDIIRGLDSEFPDSVKVFHAGTKNKDGHIVTAGGRVLCVTGLGDNLRQAQQQVYKALGAIHYEGMFYRADIGRRALKRET